MMWTIAGLVLAVLTLGGVTLSSYQSVDAAGAKMLAIEAGNIAVATKMWVANDASDGTFSSINAASMAKYIPDFTVGGSGATGRAARPRRSHSTPSASRSHTRVSRRPAGASARRGWRGRRVPHSSSSRIMLRP